MKGETVNPDLRREREHATFDVDELTHLLDGGEFITERRREVEEMALQNELYRDPMQYHFKTRTEKHGYSVHKISEYLNDIKKHELTGPADLYFFRNVMFPNEAPPHGLHFGMFLPTLQNQASDEQKEKWLKKAENFEIIGTYAQTELGHGTHVRGLETTATYDPKTQEFVIHCNTKTAAKWWPGGLGKTTNHVVLMAQLYTRGQNYGIHPFFVQTRDMDTHEPLPGVTIGDIGPKFGYAEMDNGFMLFDNYRIPRENMLAKNAEVMPDGTFVSKKKEQKKLSYGTMMMVRSMIVSDFGGYRLAQAVTIAVRYSAIRRQSILAPGEPEPQVLDFQTQQYKLLPILATAYAHAFMGNKMISMYFNIASMIAEGDTELMPELHAISSCLKAFTTDHMRHGVEQCRLACGGHGYSEASGLPKIYKVSTPAATYEGENTVMYLQTARYLMKAYSRASAGDAVSGSASYLCEKMASSCNLTRDCAMPNLIQAYRHRAARFVTVANQRMEKLMKQGKAQHDAWNLSSVSLVKAAKAHAHFYIVATFSDVLKEAQTSEAIKEVLHQLWQLYALYGILENAADFMEDGFMSATDLSYAKETLLGLLSRLRPNAVALVDAFDIHDMILSSALGRYDGNVYEELYRFARRSELNKTEVVDAFHKYLKPLRDSLGSKL